MQQLLHLHCHRQQLDHTTTMNSTCSRSLGVHLLPCFSSAMSPYQSEDSVSLNESTITSSSGDSLMDMTDSNPHRDLAPLDRDIYQHLLIAEIKNRPSTNYMETVQKDLNASMRAALVDWLVEVTEHFELANEALYLSVNYMDRYLSSNVIRQNRFQLLGATCMLIASKHEERNGPNVYNFCSMTANRYSKEEVLQMEADVLKCLKYEVSSPTPKCFLRGLIHVARGFDEFLADYIAELSLLDYSMLRYRPSKIAAAAVFLANFILRPTEHPWNSVLRKYTMYQPCELWECVKDLHILFRLSPESNFAAIREKYSKLKYKYVAWNIYLPWIPSEFFLNPSI